MILPVSICNGPGPFGLFDHVVWWAGVSSLQSAGVGGTGSRLVPCAGGRLVRKAEEGASSAEAVSEALLMLCDRLVDGGGPGGGGGSGMPGSHLFWLEERLAAREDCPFRPIPPVEAARRDAGGFAEDSADTASGARAIACTVVSRSASIALTVVVFVAFPLDVNDESIRSAWFLDDERTRLLSPDAGGGGGKPGATVALGESIEYSCEGTGDRPM